MAPSADGERSLEYSSTWALAIVATVFVTVSYIVERLLHWLGHVCFFQQIYIPRADYITLRQGFTSNQRLRDDYNFDKYMVRCMEDEFEKIVGISAKLWAFVILFLLFNVNGVYLYFWSSFIPVIVSTLSCFYTFQNDTLCTMFYSVFIQYLYTGTMIQKLM